MRPERCARETLDPHCQCGRCAVLVAGVAIPGAGDRRMQHGMPLRRSRRRCRGHLGHHSTRPCAVERRHLVGHAADRIAHDGRLLEQRPRVLRQLHREDDVDGADRMAASSRHEAIPFNGADARARSATQSRSPALTPTASSLRRRPAVDWAGAAVRRRQRTTRRSSPARAPRSSSAGGASRQRVVAAGPTTYEHPVRLASGATQYNACVQTTVTGTRTFYVGVEIAFDWQRISRNSAPVSTTAVKAALLDKTVQLEPGEGPGRSRTPAVSTRDTDQRGFECHGQGRADRRRLECV